MNNIFKKFVLVLFFTFFQIHATENRIILIHGLGRKSGSMRHIGYQLSANPSFSTLALDYNSFQLNFDESFVHLSKLIQQDMLDHPEFSKYHIVGHSLGGILGLKLWQKLPADQRGSLVCLGSPFLGTPWMDPDHTLHSFVHAFYGDIIHSLSHPPSLSMEESSLQHILLIAGNSCPDTFCFISENLLAVDACTGASDCLVSVQSALGIPDTADAIFPVTHEGLLHDQCVLEKIYEWIETHQI